MGEPKVSVVLIEDNPGDITLAKMALPTERFATIEATTLSDGIIRIEATNPDVILLDLNLPDSLGLDSLDSILDRFPHVPVVVLTSLDPAIGEAAVRRGAQDFIPKEHLHPELMTRALLYSIARHELLQEERARREALERESRLVADPGASATTLARGPRPLRTRDVEAFNGLVDEFNLAVTRGVEEKRFGLAAMASPRIASLAQALVDADATARDAMDITIEATRSAASRAGWASAFLSEARIRRTELLAHMLERYRLARDADEDGLAAHERRR